MKRLKLLISILLGATCFFGVCTAFSGCQTNKTLQEPNETISFQEDIFGGVFMNEINQLWGIFRSQEEAKTFFDSYNIQWDNLPIWERFSTDFYKDNALIFYSSWQSDQSINRIIYNAYINKNTLTLDIVGEVPESKVHDGKIEINTDSIFLTTIIKVNQTDIININTVTAKFRYEIIK